MNDINDIALTKTQSVDKATSRKKVQAESENFAAVLDQAMTKTQNNVLDRERQVLKQREKNRSVDKKQKKEEILPSFVSLPMDNLKTVQEHNSDTGNFASGTVQKISGNENEFSEQGSGKQTNNSQTVSLAALNKLAGEEEGLPALSLLLRKDNLNLNTVEAVQKNNAALSFQSMYQEMIKEATAKKEGDTTKLRLVLQPEELGELEINFVLHDKKLQISIAASEETRKMMQNSESELKNLFAANGFQNIDLSFTQFGGRRESENFTQGRDDLMVTNGTNSTSTALNVNDKKDIINKINTLVTQLVINYVA